jgi:hypothetical protein
MRMIMVEAAGRLRATLIFIGPAKVLPRQYWAILGPPPLPTVKNIPITKFKIKYYRDVTKKQEVSQEKGK